MNVMSTEAKYRTDLTACSCPGYWYRRMCRHIAAYRDAVALVLAQDAANVAWDTGRNHHVRKHCGYGGACGNNLDTLRLKAGGANLVIHHVCQHGRHGCFAGHAHIAYSVIRSCPPYRTSCPVWVFQAKHPWSPCWRVSALAAKHR